MRNVYDRPISIQRINETTEEWETLYTVHSSINKAKTDDKYLSGGAIQGKRNLVFEIRYFSALEDISLNLSLYRIIYNNVPYDINDFDDYMLQHRTVKLLGVSY